jgi:protoheme IX farnesyltransferase
MFILLAARLVASRAGDLAGDRADDGDLYAVRAASAPARNLFAFSILYLFLLFAALLGEHLLGAAPLMWPR